MKKTLLTLLTIGSLSVFAQNEFYNDGADIYTQKGALIHIQGTLTNDDGGGNGSINNDGVIEVKGDIENQTGAEFKVGADATSTDRAVKFIGSGTQAIKGTFSSNGTASFYNLVVDKAASSDQVEMQTNVNVEGSIVFDNATTTTTYSPSVAGTSNNQKGLLTTFQGSNEYLLHLENSALDAVKGYPSLVMNGAPTTGYILTRGNQGSSNGGFQRRVVTGGNTDYVFPIGTLTNGFNAAELKFGVTNGNIPAGGGNIKAKFCDHTGYVGNIPEMIPQNPPYGTDNTGYNRFFWDNDNPCGGDQWVILEDGIQNHGYWSFDKSVPGTFQYAIEAYANSFVMDGAATDTWRLLKKNGTYGDNTVSLNSTDWGAEIESTVGGVADLLTWTKNTGCYSGAGIPGGVYANFSHFMMGKAKSSNGLPVELISLTANPIDNEYIRVNWSTAIEINNDGFYVERSTDAQNWTTLGWVDGHDNSTVQNDYLYNDYQVSKGVLYYYRLKQTDNDGQFEYFGPVTAILNGSLTFDVMDFRPNPAATQTSLIVNATKEQVITVDMYDVIGQIVISGKYNINQGYNKIDFDLTTLAAGTYTGVVTSGNETFSRKVIITR